MGLVLRVLVAAGLAVDAVVHWRFAPQMRFVPGGSIHADTIFYVQAVVAGVAGVLVLVRARRWTYALALIVAASAVGALLLYFYVDVGAIGPIPNMHEPVWYAQKTQSLVGEGVAALAALAGMLTVRRQAGPATERRVPERVH
ncbi:hypothetical protein [Actinomadura harenae]|uniref:Uncharacterized protein n=1 Tax=Actinomadura harenae TaxID=2483351 RepID=A0A3M2MFQ1_9ACTN|nr:hypothetical protein [Actinomadura harenae]RMI47693.1 hypothetical protein EBO15_02035 [Actinomadura harenae]